MNNLYPDTIKFRLNLLFHYCKHHKKSIGALQIWFICRYVLDPAGNGWINTPLLMKFTKDNLRLTIQKCRQSELFTQVGAQKIYYVSWKKIYKIHKLRINGVLMRTQKLTKELQMLLADTTKFKTLIVRLLAESDLDKKTKHKFTVGRISYSMMAKKLKISRRTAINHLQASGAKIIPNKRIYRNFEITTSLSNWILNNMDTVVDMEIRDCVGNCPTAYFTTMINGKKYLGRVLPNKFKFTGISLARPKFKVRRGQHLKERPP